MNIAFVLINNMLSTSLTWPSEMWASAEQQSRVLFAQKKVTNQTNSTIETGVNTTLVASLHNIIKAHGGLTFSPEVALSSNSLVPIKAFKRQTFDLVYVPALWRNPFKALFEADELIQWLQFQYENGATLCGVGTGCCLLAETGLLDHKPATTHWYFFDQFEKHYPNIELKRQHFITNAGSIYCAASINSLADLTIHFIQRHYGKAIAQHIERHFSHEIRKDYERISFVDQENLNHPDETVLQIQLWMQDHLSENITIKGIAKKFGMSERNLNRRFKSATNNSPNYYLQTIRIGSAQDLLQYSNLTITEIAERSGFNDLSYFAKIFKQHRSISPTDYRKTVRAKLFSQTS